MHIGMIGAGNVGAALGRRWCAAGHDVMFGVRDPRGGKVQGLVAELGSRAFAGTVADAAAFGEIIVLATPFDAAEQALRQAGSVAGKVIVDCSNPLKPDLTGLSIGHATSAGEAVARWARDAKVVKALNTTGAGNMLDPLYGGEAATMFICGDDAEAKALVGTLVGELGFDLVDAGPLAQARLLEPLAMLWISLAYARGLGPDIAFRLMRRGRAR
jgi:8-hydroxy-5-deazaflavin:NADPH oxidoreductase